MIKGIWFNEVIEVDIKLVEMYLNYIFEINRVSGLYWEIKWDYELY